MKRGLTDALRRKLRQAPSTARLYTELVRVHAEDIRDRGSEVAAATLTSATAWGDGRATVTETSTTSRIAYTTGSDALTNISSTLTATHAAALWVVSPAMSQDAWLRKVSVYVTRRRVAGNPAFDGFFTLRLWTFGVPRFVLGSSGSQAILEPVCDYVRIAASSMAADTELITFSFGGAVDQVPAIPLSDFMRYGLSNPNLFVTLVAAGGGNTNYAWLSDAAASNPTTTAGVGDLYHYSVVNMTTGTNGTIYSQFNLGTGLPRITFETGTYAASGQVAYQDLDLGAVPTGTVQFVLKANVPASCTVVGYARVTSTATYTAFTDGQTAGEIGGSVATARYYDVYATMVTPAALDFTPTLQAIGVRDVTALDLSELADWGAAGFNERVDPVTGESVLGEAVLPLVRTGANDYRGLELLLTETGILNYQIRVSLGHPDLADRMQIGLFDIDDYEFTENTLSLTLVSAALAQLKGKFPAATTDLTGYFLSTATSTLTGGTFNKLLAVATSTAATITVAVATNAVVTCYAFTPINVPGLRQWPDGDYTVTMQPTATASNLWVKARIVRVNSGGTPLASATTTYSEEYNIASTSVITMSMVGVALPIGAAADRARIEYRVTNNSATASGTVTFEANTADTEIVCPWTPAIEMTPSFYNAQTIQAAYNTWLQSDVGLAERYRGVPPPNTTDLLTKAVMDADGKRELERIARCDGGSIADNGGRVDFINLWKPRQAVVAVFPMEEFAVTEATQGLRARLPVYKVPYGYDGAKFTGEVKTIHSAANSSLGPSRIDHPDQSLEEETAKWIPEAKVASELGALVVNALGYGMTTITGRPIYPHPELSLGDLVAVETDRLAIYSPVHGGSLRGPLWALAVVIARTGLMGEELTLWVRGLWDLFGTSGTVTKRSPYEPIMVDAVDYIALDRPTVARVGFRVVPVDATVYYYYAATGVAVPDFGDVLWTAYTAGNVVEFTRPTSGIKYLYYYGTRNGLNGTVCSLPVNKGDTMSAPTLTITWSGTSPNITVTANLSAVSGLARKIRWYARKNAASGSFYPTSDGTTTGDPDPAYLVIDKPTVGESSIFGQSHTAQASNYATNDYSYWLVMLYDIWGNAAVRQTAVAQVTAAATPGLTAITWVNNVVNDGVARTYDFAWTPNAGVVSATHDLAVYYAHDGEARVTCFTETAPATVVAATNQATSGITDDDLPPAPVHTTVFTWELLAGATVVASGSVTPAAGDQNWYGTT